MSNPEPRCGRRSSCSPTSTPGRAGPQVGAFFDFDGTLIDGYSLSAFARHHLRSLQVDAGRPGAAAAHRPARRDHRGGLRAVHRCRHARVGRAHRGRARRAGRAAVRAGHRRVAVPGGVAAGRGAPAGRAHRRAGLAPRPGSRSSPRPGRWASSTCWCHRWRSSNGICTGRAGGPLLWRAGKAAAVRAFAAEHDIDLAQSYAYSNGDEDVPFLRTVGRPRALNPGRELADGGAALRLAGGPVPLPRPARAAATSPARRRGWRACSAASPPARRWGRPTGSRREAVDLGITLAGELGSVLAGVRLDVHGAEHLATRPAVFLFNHQSQLDVLILAKLLRGGFTGVAKKELAQQPRVRADVPARRRRVRRPRTTTRRRVKALEPAVQKLRDGISLVIAPEGTRSADPGARAVQEGRLPRRDAGRRADRADRHPQRRRADVAQRDDDPLRHGAGARCCPRSPPTAGRVEELDEHIAEVRGQYLATLANWPSRRCRAGDGHGAGQPRPGRPAPGGAAGLGHRHPDEPAGDGDVAGRGGRPPAAGQRHPAGAARPRARLGPAARRARVGLADGAADAAAGGRAGARRSAPRRWVTGPGLRPRPGTSAGSGCPPAARMRHLLDVVQEFAAAPFDRDRPLWEALLVEGLADGRAGYVVKSHHSVTDGLGAVQLMARLHSRTPRARPAPARAPGPRGRDGASRVGLFAGQVAGAVRSAPTGGAAAGRRARRRAGAAVGDGLTGGGRGRPARSVSSARTRRGPRGSALLARRGGGWHFEIARRAAGRPQGRGEGGRRLAQRRAAGRGDRRVPPLPRVATAPRSDRLTVGFPISLRNQDDPQGGNRFTGARFAAPMAETRPGRQDRRRAAVRAGRPRRQRRRVRHGDDRARPGGRLAARAPSSAPSPAG